MIPADPAAFHPDPGIAAGLADLRVTALAIREALAAGTFRAEALDDLHRIACTTLPQGNPHRAAIVALAGRVREAIAETPDQPAAAERLTLSLKGVIDP